MAGGKEEASPPPSLVVTKHLHLDPPAAVLLAAFADEAIRPLRSPEPVADLPDAGIHGSQQELLLGLGGHGRGSSRSPHFRQDPLRPENLHRLPHGIR